MSESNKKTKNTVPKTIQRNDVANLKRETSRAESAFITEIPVVLRENEWCNIIRSRQHGLTFYGNQLLIDGKFLYRWYEPAQQYEYEKSLN